LEDILHGNSLQEARHDISELKEKVIEHAEVCQLTNEFLFIIPSLGPYRSQITC
jgi:hypothetical protein